MLAGKTKSVWRYDSGNTGLKSSKTLSAIERVCAVFKSTNIRRPAKVFRLPVARLRCRSYRLPKLEFRFGKVVATTPTNRTDRKNWRRALRRRQSP